MMEDIRQEFGKLQADVAYVSKEVDKMGQTQTIILSKLESLSDEISVYKTVIRVFRWLGLAIVAIAGWNWDKLATLWEHVK